MDLQGALGNLAKGIVNKYIYNPQQGIFPSNLYNQFQPTIEAQKQFAQSPTEQNKTNLINKTSQLSPLVMGMTGGVREVKLDPTNLLNNIETWKKTVANPPNAEEAVDAQQRISKAIDYLNKNGYGKYVSGEPNNVKITNYSQVGSKPMGESVFFSEPGGGHEGNFGDILTTKYVDKSKLFQGNSSWDFLENNSEWKKADPWIKQMTGLNSPYEVSEAYMGNAKYIDKMNEAFQKNPNLVYTIMQQKAANILRKSGFPGARWSQEDELVPLQYQIWDKSILKDK